MRMHAITATAAAALQVDAKRLPVEGTPWTTITVDGIKYDGTPGPVQIEVQVRPLRDQSVRGYRKPHRLIARCPHCKLIMSAGRMHQHMPACGEVNR